MSEEFDPNNKEDLQQAAEAIHKIQFHLQANNEDPVLQAMSQNVVARMTQVYTRADKGYDLHEAINLEEQKAMTQVAIARQYKGY